MTHEEAIHALAVMTERHQDFTFLSEAEVDEMKRKEGGRNGGARSPGRVLAEERLSDAEKVRLLRASLRNAVNAGTASNEVWHECRRALEATE